jgi:hypothetical protein
MRCCNSFHTKGLQLVTHVCCTQSWTQGFLTAMKHFSFKIFQFLFFKKLSLVLCVALQAIRWVSEPASEATYKLFFPVLIHFIHLTKF